MSLLSHDGYQYDSLILSKQTWAYPQHLQRLLWCVVSVRLNLPVVEERKLCPIRYYANCVSTTLTVLILHNVESVYFFYSNPVFLVSVFDTRCLLTPSTLGIFVIKTDCTVGNSRQETGLVLLLALSCRQAEGKDNRNVGCVTFCCSISLVFWVCLPSSDRWKLCLWLDSTVFYRLVCASVYVYELKEWVAVVMVC